MIYLYWYLGIGVAALALIFGAHWLADKDEVRLFRDGPDPSNPDRRKLSYRILNNLVAPALAAVVIVLFWPVAACMKAKELFSKKGEHAAEDDRKFAVKRSQLQELLSVQAIEDREIVHDPLGAVPNLPFGHLNAAWRRYLEGLADGDEIWSFTAQCKGVWGRQELREGYALVRNGHPGDCFLTMRKEVPDEAEAGV